MCAASQSLEMHKNEKFVIYKAFKSGIIVLYFTRLKLEDLLSLSSLPSYQKVVRWKLASVNDESSCLTGNCELFYLSRKVKFGVKEELSST